MMRSVSGQDVTVIVPAYQAEAYLAATLDTIARQIVQPHEVVIVDDGSTDRTVEVAEAFARSHRGCAVRVLREPHRGPGAARNAGVRAATTEWISFFDSDDLWEPAKIERVLEAIRQHPEANFFCHNETIIFLDGSRRVSNYSEGYDPGRPLPPQLYRENYFSTSAVVCRRQLVMNWGGFDETLSSAQDYELWLRMSPDIRPVFISDPLGSYVLRAGNITTSRYWRRLRNALVVKLHHRDKVDFGTFIVQTARVGAIHLAVPVRNALRRWVSPGSSG